VSPHTTTIAVRFAELDPYGHVNHAVYATYFEVGRAEALDSVGLPLSALADSGYQFVVTELTIRFRRAATAGSRLTVETVVSEVGRASTRWSQRIIGDGAVMATAELRVGVTDRSGRPTRPPSTLSEQLAPLRGQLAASGPGTERSG
jgi:acyl-CoA thioester hydrolase